MRSDLFGDREFVVFDENKPVTDLEPVAVMGDPAGPEIRHALPRQPRIALEGTDHAAVGDDDDIPTGELGLDSAECAQCPFHEGVVKFVAGWPPVVGEIARPILFDLRSGETLPFAGIAFGEFGVDDDRADTDLLADDPGGGERPVEGRGDDDVDGSDALGGVKGLKPTEIGEGRIGRTLPTAKGVPLRLSVAYKQHPGHGVDGTRRGRHDRISPPNA